MTDPLERLRRHDLNAARALAACGVTRTDKIDPVLAVCVIATATWARCDLLEQTLRAVLALSTAAVDDAVLLTFHADGPECDRARANQEIRGLARELLDPTLDAPSDFEEPHHA